MIEVGIRELRDHLSLYLRRVQDGEEVVVTDREREIARIIATGGERTIDRLIAEGLVTPALTRKQPSNKAIKAAGTASDLVAEQRR